MSIFMLFLSPETQLRSSGPSDRYYNFIWMIRLSKTSVYTSLFWGTATLNCGARLGALFGGVCGFELNDTVNWCSVAWCKQNVRRDGSSLTWPPAM